MFQALQQCSSKVPKYALNMPQVAPAWLLVEIYPKNVGHTVILLWVVLLFEAYIVASHCCNTAVGWQPTP